ncbi:249_t:CDS:1, partial [Gigaspora rosea]
MANLYETVITELSSYNNNDQISSPINVPYEPLQDYQAQTAVTYQCLLQSNRTGNQKALLWHAYYLGELLEMMPPEQRALCVKQLTRYYVTSAVRIYYIFRKW